MESMEIRVTFLTPAFLYGVDKNKPEFRIPSLIGQMCYWWSMTQDWSDIKNLREKEGEVFEMVAGNKKSFPLKGLFDAMRQETI